MDSRSKRDKILRALWQVVRALFFAVLPGPLFKRWRLFVLRCFGAKLGKGCRVEASCIVWWPGNLVMGDYACLAQGVDCYNVAPIVIGDYATISQRAFLCSASHATDSLARPLVFSPISIESHAWVGAEAFVGPGVTVAEGAVLGARAVAIRDLSAWSIHVGNPARAIKQREIRQ
ncbi:putative colanic acid biosynthesis acetyltransferase [Chlorobium sp. N1]|uniref:putative colanic acid biosynthesis acetyltransferase n=1 Tax=Chlorobium sp. N1 TaxID=2491138 RepID=UPI001038EB6D|nr:putative colanic acid biosynthesis acetyltransferase [Chlorobium sp. N1]TCD47538.1 putative colanic acid biosynthesis acetyltransferase [Chlorobium sp. N1]